LNGGRNWWIPNRRAITAIGMPAARRNRRISAQSSTLNTS
jgi:hypothetical protein